MPTYSDYRLAVANTLALFQFLEQSLREYVGDCYGLLAKSAPPTVAFRFSIEDLRKDSLGTLVAKAKRFYSHEDDLLKRIDAIVQERNHCAHQSMLHFVEDMKNPTFTEMQYREVAALNARVKALIQEFLPKWRIVQDANRAEPARPDNAG